MVQNRIYLNHITLQCEFSQSKPVPSVELKLTTRVCLVCVPWRLSDQHRPVKLALDVRVARATGVNERVEGDQDETLRVEFPDLNRQLPDRGETQHRRHRHLCREESGREGMGKKTILSRRWSRPGCERKGVGMYLDVDKYWNK